MAPTPFPWEDLVELITDEQQVVPIVGEGLTAVEWEGETLLFSALLARKLAEKYRTEPGPLHDVTARLLKSGIEQLDICRALNKAQGQLLGQLRDDQIAEPLRLLSTIKDFPLILTTCTNGLLSHALSAVRAKPEQVIIPLGGNYDLRDSWAPSAQPTVVHLFGSINTTPNFALTEEDTLECLCQFHDDRRPERLLDELRERHLLFVGTRFSNWLARMFMRALRGRRPSEDPYTKAIVDDDLKDERQLTLFVEHFAKKTWLYTEGNTAEFVVELYKHWKQATPTDTSPMPARPSGEPEAMPDGAIFVSYASEDRDHVDRLVRRLEHMGLQVWFDRNELRAGDYYDSKIRRYIASCDLFIATISRQTEQRDEAYFRREWRWALQRAEAMTSRRRFIVPIIIDDVSPKELQKIPDEFQALSIESAPTGQVPESLAGAIMKSVRQLRASRSVA